MRKRIQILLILFLASPLFAREYWYGIYLKGNKIGYSSLSLNKTSSGYNVKEKMVMQLKMLGETKKVESETDVITDSRFNPLSLKFSLTTRDQKVKGDGKISGKNLHIQLHTSGGGIIERDLTYSGILHTNATLKAYLMNFLPQKNMQISLFDPSTVTLSHAELNFISFKDTLLEGNKRKVFLYTLVYEGVTSKLYVIRGHILKEEGPMGIVQKEESKEEALAQGSKVDLIRLYSVKPSEPIHAKKYLKLKLLNIIPSQLDLNMANQKVVSTGKNYVIIELKEEEIMGAENEMPDSIQKYLYPDSYVQSDAPEILQLASYITQGSRNNFEKVEKILTWVYKNLEKKPSVTVPTALDVLKTGYGDCNEHSVLFAALARAAGIPTEIVVGLIYQAGAYYYHAWDAVWLDGKWVFVDPIFYEFPASLNHLFLKRGSIEKQTEIIQVVGNLKIVVLKQK